MIPLMVSLMAILNGRNKDQNSNNGINNGYYQPCPACSLYFSKKRGGADLSAFGGFSLIREPERRLYHELVRAGFDVIVREDYHR